MAFRFGDPGGRLYGTASFAGAYWSSVGAVNPTLVASGGRTTGTCLRLNVRHATLNPVLSITLDNQATMGMAFAFKMDIAQPNAQIMAGFRDGITDQINMIQNTDRTFSIARGATVLGTTTFFTEVNAWHHYELKTTIHPSAGTAQLWIDGTSRLNLTGINTRNSANSWVNAPYIGAPTASNNYSSQYDFDDVIIYDGNPVDAAGNADIVGPIGDCGLAWFLPTGAGATTQFTPSTGANYAQVNEATPNGDTSYVESATIGQVDTYTLADLPANISAVKSVALVYYARKTDVGSRGMVPVLRTGGVDYPHAIPDVMSDSFKYFFHGWGRNPGTTNPWTVSEFNAIEAGQKITS